MIHRISENLRSSVHDLYSSFSWCRSTSIISRITAIIGRSLERMSSALSMAFGRVASYVSVDAGLENRCVHRLFRRVFSYENAAIEREERGSPLEAAAAQPAVERDEVSQDGENEPLEVAAAQPAVERDGVSQDGENEPEEAAAAQPAVERDGSALMPMFDFASELRGQVAALERVEGDDLASYANQLFSSTMTGAQRDTIALALAAVPLEDREEVIRYTQQMMRLEIDRVGDHGIISILRAVIAIPREERESVLRYAGQITYRGINGPARSMILRAFTLVAEEEREGMAGRAAHVFSVSGMSTYHGAQILEIVAGVRSEEREGVLEHLLRLIAGLNDFARDSLLYEVASRPGEARYEFLSQRVSQIVVPSFPSRCRIPRGHGH